jgi:hypothetical protein
MKKELVEWKVCRTCGQMKEIEHFNIKKAQKKLADGTTRHYEPAPLRDCKKCQQEIYRTRYFKRARKFEQRRKEQILMEALTPELHPYLYGKAN